MLNSKGLYQNSRKDKESCDLVFTSSKKREIILHFHVVVVQQRLRNVQKSVIHVQGCCFTNPNLLFFFAVLVVVAVVVVKPPIVDIEGLPN